MKRIATILAAMALSCTFAFGWGRLGHATVARIAEDHLTETTKKALAEYLHGESIVLYASYADEYKSALPYDFGFVGDDGQQVRSYPHTFEADMNFKPFHGFNDNGRYVKNCIEFIDMYSKDLKEGAKDMDDSLRFIKIVMLVHWLGDMHCPEHIRYNPDDMTIGYYNVTFKKDQVRYHTFWDDQIITIKYSWGFGDFAHLLDTATDKQYREIAAGDVWDWAEDSARNSWPVHSVKEGDKLGVPFLMDNLPLARQQLRNAGYRLAHQLNMIFDARYARKASRKASK